MDLIKKKGIFKIKESENKRIIQNILMNWDIRKKVDKAISDEQDDNFNGLKKVEIVKSNGLDRDKIYEIFTTNDSNIMVGYTPDSKDYPEGFKIMVKQVGNSWINYHFSMKGKLEATDKE